MEKPGSHMTESGATDEREATHSVRQRCRIAQGRSRLEVLGSTYSDGPYQNGPWLPRADDYDYAPAVDSRRRTV